VTREMGRALITSVYHCNSQWFLDACFVEGVLRNCDSALQRRGGGALRMCPTLVRALFSVGKHSHSPPPWLPGLQVIMRRRGRQIQAVLGAHGQRRGRRSGASDRAISLKTRESVRADAVPRPVRAGMLPWDCSEAGREEEEARKRGTEEERRRRGLPWPRRHQDTAARSAIGN